MIVPTVERGLRDVDFWSMDVGCVHLPEELARVGGQGFHVAALSLGENRIEGEG